MGNFPGGSAFAMVAQITEGYLLVTERTFRRLAPPELEQLAFEIDKRLRGLRSESPPLEDVAALKARNRRLQRLNGARLMLQTYRRRRR
ncbi:MAG: hypothetical protein D6696_04425 [Acidobacteria bacterium]|nr:MAG: hypothetical protein D6696_04425 [Acidobacteriota bacterium]